MPDPISWYTLGKEIGDPTTIDEEIDAKILEHNFDASAHGQSDEAVYNHRISEVLDHVNYAIYNIKLNPSTRPIKAFVDVGGAAEFSRISDAIAYVHELAGGRIFIKAGTYTLNADLTMYSDIQFEGEDDELTIIDFNGDHKIIAEGVWDGWKKNISFKNLQFKGYRGDNSKAMYFKYFADLIFEDCRFSDNHYLNFWNPSPVIYTDNVQNIHFLRCKIDGNDRLISSYDTNFLSVDDCDFNSNFSYNIYLNGVSVADFSNNRITQNEDYFMMYEGGAGKITFNKNKFIEYCSGIVYGQGIGSGSFTDNQADSFSGSNHAFYFDGCGDLHFSENDIMGAGGSGIKFHSTIRSTIIGNNIQDCGEYGVDIDNAASSKNTVALNEIMGNAIDDIHDLGTGTIVEHNQN